MRKVNPTRLLLFLPVAAQVKSAQVTQHKSAPRQLKSAPVSPQVSPKYIYIYIYIYTYRDMPRFQLSLQDAQLFNIFNISNFQLLEISTFSTCQHIGGSWNVEN